MSRRGLTDRQRRFVEEYLIDLNATQAAIRAGYSAHSSDEIGRQQLGVPGVAEAVAKAIAIRSRKSRIHADNVLDELAAIAFATASDFAEWSTDGVELKPSTDLDSRAISEVRSTTTRYGTNVTLKLHDKLAALKLLGQHLGILLDAVTVQFDVDRVAQELASRYGTTPERVVSLVERLRQRQAG